MEKINFVNNTTPALNATNLNKLQQNIEEELNEITPKFEYSTTETVVGKWIDNKPIYRKVIHVNSLTPSGTDYANIPHGINNIDKLVNIRCMGSVESSTFFNFTNYTWFDENNGTVHVFVDNQYIGVMYQGSGTMYFVDDAYFILEYTKTTD